MTSLRPGFGRRMDAVAELLVGLAPVATSSTVWANGTMPLRCAAYDAPVEPPWDLVGSIRCIVRVGDRFVCCRNVDGAHPWPGGRREPGESPRETAVREVREETGWIVDSDVRRLGWLHMEHAAPPPEGYDRPYPDFFQLVVVASASGRDATHTVDVDGGYEREHWLSDVESVVRTPGMDPLAVPFLRALT